MECNGILLADKKVVKPSSRKRMAVRAITEKKETIRLACKAFKISEYCYRYQPKLDEENELIADWLIRLTHNQRNWGFGLCFLYLRNVKGFKWNREAKRNPAGTRTKTGISDLQRVGVESQDKI